MKKAISLLLFCCTLSLSAQQTQKLSASKANDFGIVYSLPQTALTINLKAEGTVKTPGEFYNYAERYLGSNAARNAIAAPSTSWRVTSATISTVGVPQTSGETYLVQFKAGTPVTMTLNAQGLPLSLGTDITLADNGTPPDLPPSHTVAPAETTAARYAVTEDMINSASTAKRAALAAAQIMELRQSRQDYLTGQADVMPDGAALKLILDNINAQEEALTAMFLGITKTLHSETSVDFTPTDMPIDDKPIARLNARRGFVGPDDLSGAPVYLSLSVTDKGKIPLTDKGEERKFPKNGIAYCIPGTARVTLTYKGNDIAVKNVSLAQLGVVYGLDPSLFSDKKAPAYAIFDPTTGAVTELGTK